MPIKVMNGNVKCLLFKRRICESHSCKNLVGGVLLERDVPAPLTSGFSK